MSTITRCRTGTVTTAGDVIVSNSDSLLLQVGLQALTSAAVAACPPLLRDLDVRNCSFIEDRVLEGIKEERPWMCIYNYYGEEV